MSEDRCVICGEIVPEGRMVCPDCEKKAERERDLAEELVSKWARGELVELKKGKWIRNSNGTYSCSLCQSWIPNEQWYYANYCLFCGADMREEKTE